jgi:hypothetical protein
MGDFLSGSGSDVYTEEFGAESPLAAAELTAVRVSHLVPIPAGWSLDSAYRTPLTVSVQGTSVSTAASTLYGLLSRGAQTLETQVVHTALPALQAYKSAIFTETDATPEKVPLGLGFAQGPAAVIDTGGALLIATYDDGIIADTYTDAQLDARAGQLQTTAHDLMKQLLHFEANAITADVDFTVHLTSSNGFVPLINIGGQDPPEGPYSGSGGATFASAGLVTRTGTMNLTASGNWDGNRCIDAVHFDGVLSGITADGQFGFTVSTYFEIPTANEASTAGVLYLNDGLTEFPVKVDLSSTCSAGASVRVRGALEIPQGDVESGGGTPTLLVLADTAVLRPDGTVDVPLYWGGSDDVTADLALVQPATVDARVDAATAGGFGRAARSRQRHERRIAHRRVTLRPHRPRRVRLKLSRSARSHVAKHRRIKPQLVIHVASGGGRTRTYRQRFVISRKRHHRARGASRPAAAV